MSKVAWIMAFSLGVAVLSFGCGWIYGMGLELNQFPSTLIPGILVVIGDLCVIYMWAKK